MAKPKILLAESSSIVLQIEQRCLRDAGVSIHVATDSEDVMRMSRNIRPALIYLAYTLHGAGGIACLKSLKADPELQKIPVVMVCAAGGEEPGTSRNAGCDAVVTKPVACREFLEAGLSLIPTNTPGSERIACRAVVTCSLDADTFYGAIEDISTTGMFVGSSREVAVGDHLQVKFMLPWSRAFSIETEAQVNWVNGSKQRRNDRLPAGFGVLFQGLDDVAVEQIRDYMNLVKTQLG